MIDWLILSARQFVCGYFMPWQLCVYIYIYIYIYISSEFFAYSYTIRYSYLIQVICKLTYLTHRWLSNRYYHYGSVDLGVIVIKKSTPYSPGSPETGASPSDAVKYHSLDTGVCVCVCVRGIICHVKLEK